MIYEAAMWIRTAAKRLWRSRGAGGGADWKPGHRSDGRRHLQAAPSTAATTGERPDRTERCGDARGKTTGSQKPLESRIRKFHGKTQHQIVLTVLV